MPDGNPVDLYSCSQYGIGHITLAGGVFIITGILSYLMGHESVQMMWRMIGAGAGFCLFPVIGEWIAVQVAYLNLLVKAWMLS